MTNHQRPKLFPPKALLWTGPLPYQITTPTIFSEAPDLSRAELLRIVSEMID